MIVEPAIGGKYKIINGHHRFEAAKSISSPPRTFHCVVYKDLTEKQRLVLLANAPSGKSEDSFFEISAKFMPFVICFLTLVYELFAVTSRR